MTDTWFYWMEKVVLFVLVVGLPLLLLRLRAHRRADEAAALAREIKVCHGCWRSWSLAQWPRLELIGVPEEGVEARRCECGVVLEVDLEAVARDTVELRETGLP